MKILVLGATGMAGHTVALYLKEKKHHVLTLTRSPFEHCENIIGDAMDSTLLKRVISDGHFDAIINCIGLLNQDAELHKPMAVFLNSYLPHFLSHLTKDLKTKIIHMSTDCVFSGKIGQYHEHSFKNGETFYDRSKALGELENTRDLTFRNSIIGPDMNKNGIGLLNWFMKQNGEISGYTKAIWTGVTTLTLAKAIEKAIETDLTGLYHLVNNDTISKFDLLGLFNNYMKDGKMIINPNETIHLDKSLVNTRKDFYFKVPSYDQMIREMKEWIYSHKALYPHYFS